MSFGYGIRYSVAKILKELGTDDEPCKCDPTQPRNEIIHQLQRLIKETGELTRLTFSRKMKYPRDGVFMDCVNALQITLMTRDEYHSFTDGVNDEEGIESGTISRRFTKGRFGFMAQQRDARDMMKNLWGIVIDPSEDVAEMQFELVYNRDETEGLIEDGMPAGRDDPDRLMVRGDDGSYGALRRTRAERTHAAVMEINSDDESTASSGSGSTRSTKSKRSTRSSSHGSRSGSSRGDRVAPHVDERPRGSAASVLHPGLVLGRPRRVVHADVGGTRYRQLG